MSYYFDYKSFKGSYNRYIETRDRLYSLLYTKWDNSYTNYTIILHNIIILYAYGDAIISDTHYYVLQVHDVPKLVTEYNGNTITFNR